MTTIFFKTKKSIKRFIKSCLPVLLYMHILSVYRFLFSKIPLYIKQYIQSCNFTHRQFVTIQGTDVKIMVDPQNGSLDAGIFQYSHRDDAIIALMKKYLTHGDVMFDIGANIGYETLLGACFVGKQGRVYAFEPRPDLIAQITESLQENNFDNVVLYQKAVGDMEKSIDLYVHDGEPGLTSAINDTHSSSVMKTEVITLDKELVGIQPTLIKIDIEGYEFESLKGATEILEKYHPVIIFEFSVYLYEKDYAGKSLEFLEFLNHYGYCISTIEEPEKILPEASFKKMITNIMADEVVMNFIAVAKG